MPEPQRIARLDRATRLWVAQEWSDEANRFVDVVPQREATDDEVDATDGVIHPDWAPIMPGRTSDHHWVTFGNDGDLDEPSLMSRVTFHCDAPEGADCRWNCPEDCEAFPCRHAPAPAECWALPWVDGNYVEDVFEETSLEEHQIVQRALVDIQYEGDCAILIYRTTDTALTDDTKVMTR